MSNRLLSRQILSFFLKRQSVVNAFKPLPRQIRTANLNFKPTYTIFSFLKKLTGRDKDTVQQQKKEAQQFDISTQKQIMEYLSQGKYDIGLQTLQKSIADRKTKKGEKYPRIEHDYYLAGAFCRYLNKLDDAVKYFEDGKSIALEQGNKHVIVGIMINLAQIDQQKGNLDQALKNFQQAYQYGKEINDILYIDALLNIGEIEKMQGNFLAAQKTYNTADVEATQLIESLEKQNDTMSKLKVSKVRDAQSLTCLKNGEISLMLKQHDNVEQLFNKSLQIYQLILRDMKSEEQKKHVSLRIAYTQSNLGNLYLKLQKLEKAQTILNEAEENFENSKLLHLPYFFFHNVVKAELNKTLGKLDESLSIIDETIIEMQKNYFEHYNQLYIELLIGKSQIKLAQQKPKEALEIASKTLQFIQKAFQQEHYSLVQINTILTSAYLQLNEIEKANQFNESALTLAKKFYGTEHETISQCLINQAMIQFKQNQEEKSQETFQSAIEMRNKLKVENGNSYIIFSEIQEKLGKKDKAIENLNQALKIKLSINNEKEIKQLQQKISALQQRKQ